MTPYGIVGFKKLRKYENGAMRPIMYVLDDFAGFESFLVLFARIFKKGLENHFFLLFTYDIFSEY